MYIGFVQTTWPEWLRQFMSSRRLNNKGLAVLLDVSQSTVKNWLDGNQPDIDNLMKLARLSGEKSVKLFTIIYRPDDVEQEFESEQMHPKIRVINEALRQFPDEVLDLLIDQIDHVLMPRLDYLAGEDRGQISSGGTGSEVAVDTEDASAGKRGRARNDHGSRPG